MGMSIVQNQIFKQHHQQQQQQQQPSHKTVFCYPAIIKGMHLANIYQFYNFLPNHGERVCILTTWKNALNLQSEAAYSRWPREPDLMPLQVTGLPALLPNGLRSTTSLAVMN